MRGWSLGQGTRQLYLSVRRQECSLPETPSSLGLTSLGILLLCPCLRDPCVLVPQSGDPSVWEEALGLGSFFGLLSVPCGPPVGFSSKDPFLEFHQPQRVMGLFVSKACLCKDLGLHPPALHPPTHTHTHWPLFPAEKPGSGRCPAVVRAGSVWTELASLSPHSHLPSGAAGQSVELRTSEPSPPSSPRNGSLGLVLALTAGGSGGGGQGGGDGWGHAHSFSLFQPTPSPLRGLLLDFPKPFPESQSKPGPGEGLGSPRRKKMLPRLPPGLKAKTHRGKEMGCSKQEPQGCGL